MRQDFVVVVELCRAHELLVDGNIVTLYCSTAAVSDKSSLSNDQKFLVAAHCYNIIIYIAYYSPVGHISNVLKF